MAKSYKDMVDALAGDDTPPPGDDEDMQDHGDDEAKEGDLPPEFEAAYKEYEDNPSAQTFWAAVEACVGAGGGGDEDKGHGLMIMIGKGKH